MDVVTLLVVAILFAAAYLQSATGFGGAIVCLALLPLILSISDSIAFVSAASILVTLLIVGFNHTGLSLKNAGPLCIGMVAGIPIGYYTLHQLDGAIIIRLVGIVLMVVAIAEFLQNRMKRLHIPEKSAIFFGVFAGILTGAFNTGGPPLVAYAYSRKWTKVEIVAILQAVFIAGAVTRNILMASAGEFTRELLLLVAWSFPAAVLAVWLGKITLDRLPLSLLRQIVFSLIFLIGLKYAIFG